MSMGGCACGLYPFDCRCGYYNRMSVMQQQQAIRQHQAMMYGQFQTASCPPIEAKAMKEETPKNILLLLEE